MKSITTALIAVILTGCSVFADPKQELKIVGSSAHSKVTANDVEVKVPSTQTVDKNHSVTVNAYEGNKLVFSKTVSPVLSNWGKLDTMGVYFLFPGIGLFSPGSMELDTDTIVVK